MKSVKVNVSFPNAKELQSQLDSVVSRLNNSLKIDLDTKNFNKSLNDMSKLITKLKSQLADFNILEQLSGDGTSVAKTTKEVNNLAEAMGKLNEKSQLRKKNDDEAWSLKNAQAYNKAIEDNYKTQTKLEESLVKAKDNLQGKLNTASNNSFVDVSVIDKLQNKLNSINTNTPEKEFNELKNSINNLSSSDSGIVRIQNSILRLQERISSIKNNNIDIINANEISELKQAESELSKLQSLMASLKMGEVIDGKAISNQINIANNSVKILENQFKSVDSATSGLSNSIKNIFSYAIGGSAIYAVINAMRSAISTTIELDDAMRDLRRVTELTNSEYTDFMRKANETAIALGTTTAGAIEATTRFSKLGYSFEEASDGLSKYALVLSNVADMSATEASSSIVSVLKGFQLETEDVSKIVDIINEAGNKFAIDSSGLADALKVGAANLSLAGNDLEQASALIITANEVMQDPTTVANGLKTIGMRLRGVSEDGEELSATMTDLIKNMTGVSVEGLDGELRSTYDILKDIGEVWETLNTKQQALLSEEIAGKNRANVFASLMQNAEQLENAYDTLKDSTGSAQKEQEAYMDSLSGKINALKESVTGISIQIIDSDLLKDTISNIATGVNAVSGFIDVFGGMPTTITAVVGALTVFNSKFRESASSMLLAIPGYSNLVTRMGSYEKSLKTNITSIQEQIVALKKQQAEYLSSGQSVNTLGVKMVGLNSKLALTTAGLIATKVATIALQATLSMGLTLILSTVINIISSFVSSLGDADERIQAVSESSKALADSLENVKTVQLNVDEYEKINKKLKDTTLSEQERNDLNNQLLQVKEQLYTSDEDAYSILNNQNLSYQEQLDLLRSINEEKVRERAEDLDKTLGNGFWNQDEEKNAKSAKIYIENNVNLLKELIELQEKANGGTINHSVLGVMSPEEQASAIENLKGKIDESNLVLQKYNSNVELIEKANIDTDRSTISLSDGISDFISKLSQSTQEIKANTDAKEENVGIDGVGSSDTSTSVADATKEYSDQLSKAQEIYDLLESINEEQAMSPSLIKQVAELYPEIGSSITSIGETQDFLNNKLKEQQTLADQAFETMVSNDNNYYSNKLLKDENWMNSFRQSLINMGMSQQDAYNLDLKKFDNLQQLKTYAMNTLGSGVEKWLNNYIDTSTSGYNIDFKNFKSFSEAKIAVLDALNQEVKKVTQNMQIAGKIADTASNMQSLYGTGNGIYSKLASDQLKQAQNNVKKYSDQLTGLNTAIKEVDYKLSGIGVGNITSGLIGGSPISATTNKTNGGGSNSNKGSSSAEKEIEDMETLYNRYLLVENALKKLDNELTKNNNLMENATGKEKIQYLNKELELIKKQESAYKNKRIEEEKELSEIKKRLTSGGFNFNKDGEIANYSRINSLTKWANSLSGTAKENAQNGVKSIYEDIEKYNKLLLEEIPELNNKVLELKNETLDTQKEILKTMEEMVEETMDKIEKSMDKSIDNIDKKISNMDFNVEITGGLNATNTTIFKANIIKLQKEKLDTLNKTLNEYSKITAVTKEQQESLNEKMEATKQQIIEQQQEIRKLAGAYEEYGLELLTSPYNDKMWQTGTQQMNKVDLQLQTTQDEDTAKRIALTKEKLTLQKTMVEETRKYLEKLRNTTTKTTEGYQLLLQKIKEAEEELYNQQTAYNSLNKELESFYKEKLNSVASVESQISELIKKNAEERIAKEKEALDKSIENDKKRIESKKKALNEEQKLYNKKYSEDNYEADLNEEKNKLLQLQSEIDKLQFATDAKSKNRLESLIKEYSEQQKLINDKIAEHQNQAINDRFEEEQDLLDKELESKQDIYENAIDELDKKLENFLTPENLTNLVSTAMNSGFVNILGQTVNLNDAMKEMLKESEVGVANLNIKFNDWLDKLTEIKGVASDITGLMKNSGLDANISLANTRSLNSAQPITIDMGGINIEGSVNEDTLKDLDKMFKKQQDDILSIVTKKLSGK